MPVIDQEVIGYYKCPEAYGACVVDAATESSSDFVQDAISFGKSSRSSSGQGDPKFVTVPRLAGAVVDALRSERYVANPSPHGWKALWKQVRRSAYYALRPALGVSVRRHLQRQALRDWSAIPFPHWPVDGTADQVFESFLALSMQAHGVDSIPFIWFWPEGHPSCCIMTHDIETAAGVKACDDLMDLDGGIGLAASFQAVPEGRYEVTERSLARIRNRGFEVNVHDLNHDGRLYDDRDEFLRRAEKINQYVSRYGAKGFRSAVLYRNVDWYDAYNFAYDMSVPNVAHLDPQRGGCCTIRPYFIGNIVELPLTTTQDYSLFHILDTYSLDLWKQQANYIIQHNGLLSFNIHPDYLATPPAREAYSSLLDFLAALRQAGRTYFALPGEVQTWWRERQQMKLVYEAEQWRVTGPGSERAVVAYATANENGLSYSFDCPRQSLVSSTSEQTPSFS